MFWEYRKTPGSRRGLIWRKLSLRPVLMSMTCVANLCLPTITYSTLSPAAPRRDPRAPRDTTTTVVVAVGLWTAIPNRVKRSWAYCWRWRRHGHRNRSRYRLGRWNIQYFLMVFAVLPHKVMGLRRQVSWHVHTRASLLQPLLRLRIK